MNPARLRAYLALLVVTTIWGLATPIIKYTLGGFETLTFLTYRFGISSLVALPLLFIFKEKLPKNKTVLRDLLGHAFLTSTVSLGFLFFGLENTTVLDASLITLANPLLITIAGVMFLREHVTKRERFGMAIAFLGTALTVLEPLIQNGGSEIRLSGNILIIGYLISTAWGAVLVKRVLRAGVSPSVITAASFIVGFISLLPFAILTNKLSITAISAVPLSYHIGVFYMALLSGNLAYYLGNKAQKTIEIGEAAVFSYLYPLFSTPLAVLWLGEKITPMFIIGGAVIAVGVILAETKKKRYN